MLVATHVLSKASEATTSKFATRRDGPYLIIAQKGSTCYVIASVNDPHMPIATHHASALTPYEGQHVEPRYPQRKRGRPTAAKDAESANSYTQQQQIDNNTKPDAARSLRSRNQRRS